MISRKLPQQRPPNETPLQAQFSDLVSRTTPNVTPTKRIVPLFWNRPNLVLRTAGLYFRPMISVEEASNYLPREAPRKKISVKDFCAQWTIFNNLKQCYKDVKKNLMRTGRVDGTKVLDEEEAWCQKFSSLKRIQNVASSTWMRHTIIFTYYRQ
jgi:hypothetical protein